METPRVQGMTAYRACIASACKERRPAAARSASMPVAAHAASVSTVSPSWRATMTMLCRHRRMRQFVNIVALSRF